MDNHINSTVGESRSFAGFSLLKGGLFKGPGAMAIPNAIYFLGGTVEGSEIPFPTTWGAKTL